MEYCITINPIPHSQYRTKFDYEWSIEYQLMRNPLVSVHIRSASLLIFKILYYGMGNARAARGQEENLKLCYNFDYTLNWFAFLTHKIDLMGNI